MKLQKPNLQGKKIGKLSLDVKITERDKKLLMVLGVVIIIALSYYVLYLPMSASLESLTADKEVMDQKVAAAKSDLENEQSIVKAYETQLANGMEASEAFFPGVYPYKEQYVLLVEKIVKGSGATLTNLEFSDPEVSGVVMPEDNRYLLPAYSLQQEADTINQAYSDQLAKEIPTAAGTSQSTATTGEEKTLPADAVLRLPTTIEFTGSYAQYRTVVTSLEKLNRAIALEAVEAKEDEKGLKFILTVSFYAVEKVDNGEDTFNAWTIKGSYGKSDPFN